MMSAILKIPEAAAAFIPEDYSENGFLGTYILHNQISSTEHVMISCVKNLVNSNQQLGLVSRAFKLYYAPCCF